MGSPSSFGTKRPFMSLNSCAFIENLASSERARARARVNPKKNDTQKGCTMQLNGITLSVLTQLAVSPIDNLQNKWLHYRVRQTSDLWISKCFWTTYNVELSLKSGLQMKNTVRKNTSISSSPSAILKSCSVPVPSRLNLLIPRLYSIKSYWCCVCRCCDFRSRKKNRNAGNSLLYILFSRRGWRLFSVNQFGIQHDCDAWKAACINREQNPAVVYVGSSEKI